MTSVVRALKPVLITVDPVHASAIPITQLAKCDARWGDEKCGAEFVQTALTEDGSIEAFEARPHEVAWEPRYCTPCQRSLLKAAAREAAYSGNLGTLRHPSTQAHPVIR